MSATEGYRVKCPTSLDAYSQDIAHVKGGDIESYPLVSLHHKDTGKPSKIQTLCKDAAGRGYEQCIWVCYNRGAKNLARDVPILSGELLEAHNFERMFGWWRRLLLRGPIKIQMVKMHVLRQRNSKEVEVMILPIDIAAELERIERALEQCGFHPECSAGFSEDGTLIPCSRPKNCRNLTMGGTEEYPQFYCSLEHHHRLRRKKRKLEHSEALLEFYWSSRGRSDFLEFLEYRGFITRYRDLETTDFLDACDGCGEGILALLLVDGWHTQRLLVLVGLAVLLSILITILGAAVGQSINMGLTAGSYTFALVAVIIATLSFFSAIL